MKFYWHCGMEAVCGVQKHLRRREGPIPQALCSLELQWFEVWSVISGADHSFSIKFIPSIRLWRKENGAGWQRNQQGRRVLSKEYKNNFYFLVETLKLGTSSLINILQYWRFQRTFLFIFKEIMTKISFPEFLNQLSASLFEILKHKLVSFWCASKYWGIKTSISIEILFSIWFWFKTFVLHIPLILHYKWKWKISYGNLSVLVIAFQDKTQQKKKIQENIFLKKKSLLDISSLQTCVLLHPYLATIHATPKRKENLMWTFWNIFKVKFCFFLRGHKTHKTQDIITPYGKPV